MALRFRRSVKIAPGLRLNFGKTGMSVSAGVRGASLTFGPKGIYGNCGIPGTGISYRTKLGGDHSSSSYSDGAIPYTEMAVSLGLDEKGYIIARDADGNELSKKFVKISIDQNPHAVNDWLKEECKKINNDVQDILEIHRKTPPLDSFTSFATRQYPKDIPHHPHLKPISLLAKIFPFMRKKIEADNAYRRTWYEEQLEKWKEGKSEFEQEEAKRRHDFEVGRFEDTKIMEEFLESVLQDIGWPRETIVDFEIEDGGYKVMVDIDLPEIEDLPDTTAEISTTGRKINFKKRSEAQRRKDYVIHIHGIGFRMVGTVFAALPKCSEIVLSAFSQRTNPATGSIKEEYLYSVRLKKTDWMNINFKNLENVDVVECLGLFEIVRNMTKTGVVKAIEPLDG